MTQICISEYVTGVRNLLPSHFLTHDLGVKRELIHTKITDRYAVLDSNVAGLHARLDLTPKNFLEHLIDPTCTKRGRIERTKFMLGMPQVTETIKLAGQMDHPCYVVLHTATAAEFFKKHVANEFSDFKLPANVRIAIENDDGVSLCKALRDLFFFTGYQDPRSIHAVIGLVDIFSRSGVNAIAVLDTEHLRHHGQTTTEKAIELLEDRLRIVHLSGVDHNGHTAEEIASSINTLPPQVEYVVLEGKQSTNPLWASNEHLEETRQLVMQVKNLCGPGRNWTAT